LHGSQLITVEDLGGGDDFHRVQRAMPENHASQCGFCTPGFVIALLALYHTWPGCDGEPPQPPRHIIETALAGNLCRCTGYRPIIDAAAEAAGATVIDQFSRAEAHTARQLKRLRRQRATTVTTTVATTTVATDTVTGTVTTTTATHFHRPKTARELAALMRAHPDARLLAGGTDLALEVTQELRQMPCLISVAGVAELTRIRATVKHLEVGAAVPLADCAAVLAAEHPAIGDLLRRFGSEQIRGQATVGGNLANASPVADLPPVLLALGAQVKLQNAGRIRRLPLADFYRAYKKTALGAGEFIRSITVPRAGDGGALHASKISKRVDDDIAAVCAAFYVRVDGDTITGARVAFGGMAATPKRAPNCEAALTGRPLSAATLAAGRRALTRDFQPISDARASAAYRMTVAQNLLDRLFLELAGETPARIAAA